MFLFSTLNLVGPAHRERPWRRSGLLGRNPLRAALNLARAVRDLPADVKGFKESKQLTRSGEGWAVAPISAHHFGIVAHFTTLSRQLGELVEAGFESDPLVLDRRGGRPLKPRSAELTGVDWFEIVARRAA